MSDDPNVVQFVRPPALPSNESDDPVERLSASVNQLATAVEQMDTGMKLFINVVTDLDKRIRKLELAQRKADRKNVPAIVNQFGERQN